MKKLKLMSILLLLISMNVAAQETDSLKTRKAQVTFAYPIGSSGISSIKYANNFSLNILYGLNGGVNGTEIGSIFNYNKGIVKGFQLSGVANINTGFSNGFLLTGVTNICLDSTSGQFIAGVLNYSAQNGKGFQLSTINIASNTFTGFQLGVFNYAKNIKGVQLGVFNFLNDSLEALPIGVFSIVRNGYYEFELAGGEAIYSNLNYKMGVEKFYTVFKTGYTLFKNSPVYSFGMGFGGNISIAAKQKISIDISYNQIVYNSNWESNGYNNLNKADINYKYTISDKFSLLVGPSLNVYITNEKVDGDYGTLNIPYTLYANEGAGSKIFMWIGLNAGFALKL